MDEPVAIQAENGRSYYDFEGSYDQLRGVGLGLAGAHRVGKSTLAIKFAEQFGWTYVKTDTAGLAKELGYDVRNMTWEQRKDFQSALILSYEDLYREQSGPFVTDRTPIDTMAYTLASLPDAMTDEDMEWLRQYQARCYQIIADYFLLVTVVQPGIPYQDDASKWSAGKQETINSLILGLVFDDRNNGDFNVMPRSCLNMKDRIKFLVDYVAENFKNMRESWGTLPRV